MIQIIKAFLLKNLVVLVLFGITVSAFAGHSFGEIFHNQEYSDLAFSMKFKMALANMDWHEIRNWFEVLVKM